MFKFKTIDSRSIRFFDIKMGIVIIKNITHFHTKGFRISKSAIIYTIDC